MDGTCKDEECIYEFSLEAEGEGSLKVPKRSWQNNIDVDLKTIEFGDVDLESCGSGYCLILRTQ